MQRCESHMHKKWKGRRVFKQSASLGCNPKNFSNRQRNPEKQKETPALWNCGCQGPTTSGNSRLMAKSAKIAQPIRLQHLHKYPDRILLKLNRNIEYVFTWTSMNSCCHKQHHLFTILSQFTACYIYIYSWKSIKHLNSAIFRYSFLNVYLEMYINFLQ